MAKKKRSRQNEPNPKRIKPAQKKAKPSIPFVKNSFWKDHWIPALIIFCLAVAIYIQSATFGYVLDDRIVITDNNFTKQGFQGIWSILSTESFQGYFGVQKDLVAGARYRPLSIVSFAIEYGILHKLNPSFSHIINIIWYAFTSVLLYRLLTWLIPIKASKKWFASIAFLACLVWTVHPVHSEAVANIKGRDEIMSLFFALGALYFILNGLTKRYWLHMILAVFSLFLGLMSKEGAITFVGIIPLALYFFTDIKKEKLLQIIGFLAVSAFVYLLVRYQVIGYFLSSGREITDLMNNPFYGMSGGEKSATICLTLLEYLRLSFFPFVLTHDYYPFHIPVVNWGHWKVLLSLFLHLGLAWIALKGIKSKKLSAFSILFYAFALSIVSNIVFPVGTFMNERFIFTATIGSSILLVWFISEFLSRFNIPHLKKISLIFLLFLVTSFAIRTLIRVPVWESALSLNKAAVKVSVNSARANCFMATALFNQYKEQTDREERKNLINDAYFYIKRSANLFNTYKNANVMVAGIASEKYKMDRDLNALLVDFGFVAKYRPDTEYLHQFLEYLNETNPDPSLINFYLQASTNIRPDQPRRTDYTIKFIQYGLDIYPNDQSLNLAMANIYKKIGNEQKANFYFSKADGIR